MPPVAKNLFWSLLVFVAIIVITAVLSGGRFIFGLFLLPLGIIPLLFNRVRNGKE